MYEVGKVYIWQNMTGDEAFLNGTETTVTGLVEYFECVDGCWLFGWPTDAPITSPESECTMALAGNLRPKNPPSGEQKVRDLFEPKPVMEPA